MVIAFCRSGTTESLRESQYIKRAADEELRGLLRKN